MKNYMKKVYQTIVFGLCILVIAGVVCLSYIAYIDSLPKKVYHPYVKSGDKYSKYLKGKYSKPSKYQKYLKY